MKNTGTSGSQATGAARAGADTRWFVNDRFGMFIHWGLYAQGARHEWLMNNESIPVEVYEQRYFKRFDPDLYDPRRWARAAAGAGMKYMVVTSKHHEGFCLWDSRYTDYKAPCTPAGRDLLRPMLDAFRAEGLRTGIYYSLIDWHHPDFVIDNRFGPYRALDEAARARLNAGRKMERYAAYMRNQIKELLTGYGPVDVLWFDFSYPNAEHPEDFTLGKGRLAWESEKLYKLVRQLAPKVIVDDRLDLPGAGDIHTPEQYQPRAWLTRDGQRVVWEACQTFSGSWGYHRDEASWRTPDELIRTLIDCVSKGGNLLLNVGPTGRGEFDARALACLEGIGAWMQRHSRSIYGCTAAPEEFKAPEDCRLTWNPATRRLYVHVLAWPYKHLHIEGLRQRVTYAQLLNDASEITCGAGSWYVQQMGKTLTDNLLTLNLPTRKPDVAVPVIELFLDGK